MDLPHANNIKYLRIAIGACLGVSAIMTWSLVWGPAGNQKASIIDALDPTVRDGNVGSATSNSPKAITDNPVVSAALVPLTDVVKFYESQTGRAFQVNLSARRTETISDKRLNGFARTYWSPDRQKVISVFEERDGIVFRYYDYGSGENFTIGESVISAAFSPDGQKIAYLENADSASSLIVSSPDGSNSKKILSTRSKGGVIEWPNKESLSLLTPRIGSGARDLSLIGLDGTLKILLSNRENLEYLWSPSGQHLLFSFYTEGQGVQLWSLDMANESAVALKVNTSATKCAWQVDENSIICGIPTGDTLNRDVAAMDTATLDSILSIDLTSKEQVKLYDVRKDALLGVGESLISSSGRYFVFRNLFDQKLYSLTLK